MENSPKYEKNKTLKAVLTYFGSFLVAVCILIVVHELGHAIAFLIKGYRNINITINPFMGTTSTTETILAEDLFLIAAGGTIFNITMSILIAGILWKFSNPYLLPLKMYPVVAFLLEGVVILAGFFFDVLYTDFAILVELGFPVVIVGIISAVLILGGIFGMYQIWSILGIKKEDSFFKILLINLGYPLYFTTGYVIMGVLIGSSVGEIQVLMLISLIIHIGLLLLMTAIRKPVLPQMAKIVPRNIESPNSKVCWYSLILGIVFIALSSIFLN